MQKSRVKDYYDVWTLLRKNLHDQKKLENTLKSTFRKRQMEIDYLFFFRLLKMMDRFLRQGGYEMIPSDLEIVCKDIVKYSMAKV